MTTTTARAGAEEVAVASDPRAGERGARHGGAAVELEPAECRRLLEGECVGRLGVVVDGKPEIFPVNYALDQSGAVVIRTMPGTKHLAALNRSVVFEVDRIGGPGPAWSVVIHGVAQHADLATLRFASEPPRPWVGTGSETLRIQSRRISGRRLDHR